MRGLLLILLVAIPALFVFGCSTSNTVEEIDSPTPCAVIEATGAGRNYQLSYNGQPGLSYQNIIRELRQYGDVVDATSGLKGRDDCQISDNPVTFSTGPATDSGAFSIVLMLMVDANLAKAVARLTFEDGMSLTREMEIPYYRGLWEDDQTDKIHIRVYESLGNSVFELWIGKKTHFALQVEPEEDTEFILDELEEEELERPPIEPPPIDMDEDPNPTESEKAAYVKIEFPSRRVTEPFNDIDTYNRSRDSIVNSLNDIINKSNLPVTGCVVHYGGNYTSDWGYQFMAIDAGAKLNLERAVQYGADR